MRGKNEKVVLRFLCKNFKGNKTYLLSPHDIASGVHEKVILSSNEIDEIMTSLCLQNYIDFVISDSKNGYYYCIKLKKKGQMYFQETKKQRKALMLLVLRSMFLASVSFIFGLILKTIFKN